MNTGLHNLPSDPELALRQINGREIDEDDRSANWQDATHALECLQLARARIQSDLQFALRKIGYAEGHLEEIIERETDNQ